MTWSRRSSNWPGLAQFQDDELYFQLLLAEMEKRKEEAKKFDVIKKGAWLRVRGNVEMNNFARDLTMNVQDVQAVTHYESTRT